MLRRYAGIMVMLLMVSGKALGQYDASFSHYWAMEPSFNPASVGKEQKLNATAAYAMQMVGFEHNPKTMYLAADMPFYALRSYHGAGVQLFNDEIGVFSHKRVGLQYAYKKRLFGGTLSAGVEASLLSENLNGSKIDLEDAGDPAFSSADVNGVGLDLGAGLYYLHRNWYLGASVKHVNQPRVELGETNELNIAATYYLTGGYNIKLRNPFLTIHTSFLGRSDGVGYRADATARLQYSHEQKLMYAGIGYSPTNSVTVFVGGRFHGVNIGYSYEAYTTAMSLGNGSHELFVGYQTEINLYKKGRNLHKSVRYL